MPPINSSSLEKKVTKIFAAQQITRADRAFLISLFASRKIDSSSEALIDSVYSALAAGKIRVVESADNL